MGVELHPDGGGHAHCVPQDALQLDSLQLAARHGWPFSKYQPAFYDGPQGIQRLEPLAQRLHVDFKTEAKFDNPRAVQLRLTAFDFDRLSHVGRKVRDIYAQHTDSADRLLKHCDDQYVENLAKAVAGNLGGKVGIAPRIFLKKLVADVLDRVDQHEDFDPRQHYKLTIEDSELQPVEREAAAASDINEIELDL